MLCSQEPDYRRAITADAGAVPPVDPHNTRSKWPALYSAVSEANKGSAVSHASPDAASTDDLRARDGANCPARVHAHSHAVP